MSKTNIESMVDDYTALEQQMRDLRLVLALLAYQQDDHTLHVPVKDLQMMPPGMELQVTFDREHDQYVFTAVVQEAPQRKVFPH